MNALPPMAGLPAPASPTFGVAPQGNLDAAAADHAAPADAFSALLARLLPGRIPLPLPLSARVAGTPAGYGEAADAPVGTGAPEATHGPAEDEPGGSSARPGISHGGSGATPGPLLAPRAVGAAGGDHLRALAAAIAAMAGDTETATRLAAEVGPAAGDPRATPTVAAGARSLQPTPEFTASPDPAPFVAEAIADATSGVAAESHPPDAQRFADRLEIPPPIPVESPALAPDAAGSAFDRAPAIAPASGPTPARPVEATRPSTVSTAAAPQPRESHRAIATAPANAAATRTAAAANPTHVERSLELLHPEFRVRLERVVTRMAEEHGHEVDIVETLRHQVRQNHLYEQGRSRPGDVVTWTRSSNHTAGVAADVIIDGSYGNPEAYARLQRVAAQEGLRTLGSRDPGHLELPVIGDDAPLATTESTVSEELPPRREDGARASRNGGLARPARVAAVADLARVAMPTVARVATPGAPAGRPVAAPATPDGARAGPADESVPGGTPAAPSPTPALEPARFDGGVFAGLDPARTGARTERTAGAALTSGAAERIAHLLDLQSSAPAKQLSQILLRVDGPGGQDQIRLDLRGGSLSGSIDLSDPLAADRLGARIGDLHRALEQHGLEAEALKIRSTPRTEVVDRLAFATATDAEALRSASQRNGDSAFQRERTHQDHNRDEPHEGSHDARQQNRKDNPGGRNS